MAEIKEIFSTEDAKAQKTIDGFDNFVARVGLNSNNVASAGSYTFNLLTRNRIQLEAAYRGSWIVGQMVDAVADDMTRAGIDITTNDDDEEIKDVQASLSKLSIWKSLNSLEKWGRLYGGAIAVLQIDGQKLDTPLNIETVGKGQFKGLCVYDRWQLNPSLNEVIDSGIDMGLPKFYNIVTTASNATLGGTEIGQIRVHHSRVIRNIGIELPFFQALTEMFWGESVLERLWDRLIPFDQVTMSAANLIERANNRTIGIEGLREIIAAGGKAQAGLEAMLEMVRQFQTNEGLTIIDKNDSWATTNYTFAGLADLIMQYGQQLSGASQIPLVRLFGQSPAGLSATGESDIRLYYDSINARQEAKFRHGVELILKVIWRSKFGKDAPTDLEFTFTSLWQMSAIDKATIAKTNAETITGVHESGLINSGTAMKELRDTSGDTGLFANISDEDIADAEEMDENPPAPELDPGKLDAPADPLPDKAKDSAIKKITKWLKR
jgi:phage-related protein (TIGR01555 family)